MTLLMYVFPLLVVHENNCFMSCFLFSCFFLRGCRAVFENAHSWQIHVTIIHLNALLSLLTCEQCRGPLILHFSVCLCVGAHVTLWICASGLDSIILRSSLTSFDICAVFLLPVWQPEASKMPFLNILKRTTLSQLPDLHASC